MIFAPRGLYARFRAATNDDSVHFTRKRIIAFDDDGCPLIIADHTRPRDAKQGTPFTGTPHLSRASDYVNYVDIEEDDEGEVIAMIPGADWIVEQDWRSDDGGEGIRTEYPVIGWVLTHNDDVYPVIWDADDHYAEIRRDLGEGWKVHHPGQREHHERHPVKE